MSALQALFVVASLVWLIAVAKFRPRPRTVLIVAVLLRAPFLFWDQYSNDLHRYVFEGRMQWEGHNPFEQAPKDLPGSEKVTHPELTTIYPPLSQAVFALAWKAGLREVGFRNLALVLDVLVVLLLLRWRCAMLYAWSPLAISAVAVGHLDPLMLLPLVGCAWAWEKGRWRTAALLLGLAILAKTMAVLMVPWLLLRRPRAVLLTAAVVVLGYLPYAGGDLFGTLFSFGADFAFNASLFRAFGRWGVAVLLVLWVGAMAVSQPRFAQAAALTFAGLLFLSPTVHFWYLSWFLVMLPAVGPRRWTWPLLAWAVSIVFASETYRAHYAGEPFAERFALTWAEYVIPFALMVWLVVRGWPRRQLMVTPEPAIPGTFAVVIPCRGEVDNLRTLVPAWKQTAAQRVVLADTPTGDGTHEIPGTTYVAVARRGYGAAVLEGVAAAGNVDFIVVCDADHARGPEQVGRLLAPLADDRVGLVTAARSGGTLPPQQRFGNWLACLLIGLRWGTRFHDLGPSRAFRRGLVELQDRGFGINVEMNVKMLEAGWKVAEVPLPASDREHGENRITGTVAGVLGAGYGMLRKLYDLSEKSCTPPSSS